MSNEIRRNNWSRFFKKFNSANQYRRTELSVINSGDDPNHIPIGPFMGVTLSKKGRFIDGIQFLIGSWNPDTITEPVITIKEPSKVWLEKDNDGRDNFLKIQSKDGTEAKLELRGEKQHDQEKYLVEKVAYSMFEHRGCCHGNDMHDWYEAEERVRHAETQLTQ